MTAHTIDEELRHCETKLNVLRERQRVLEIQAARQGTDTPPHIVTEIVAIDKHIRECKMIVTTLETRAKEARYRQLLEEIWMTPQGWRMALAIVRLEMEQQRLNIPPARAFELEHEIRLAAAEYVLSHQ